MRTIRPRTALSWVSLALVVAVGCTNDVGGGAGQGGTSGTGGSGGGSASSDQILRVPEPNHSDGGIVPCGSLVCTTTNAHYCGTLRDACGTALSCGDCPAGEECKNNICVGGNCLTSCALPGGGAYCGTIGDGCGGTLECPTTCTTAGWTCGDDHICKGSPAVCTPMACTATTGDTYCGSIGDGCGNTLNCGSCKPGWDCQSNLCVGGPAVCAALACVTPGGTHYCGTVGNGCGGTLECGASCPAGWSCVGNVCKGDRSVCTPTACTSAGGDHYCGTIGDGCGGSMDCGNSCPDGWSCLNNVCVGKPPVCTPTSCQTATGGEYCGQVGNGCGEPLDCPTSCSKPGWVCENHLCKGPHGVCTPLTCATASGDHYCGVVGDGCGGSLDCGDNCPAGWTCGTDHICRGAPPVCTPLTCTTSSGDRYCGTVGDGCGGSLECGSDCPAGWACGDDHICKAGPDLCTPATCAAPNGDQYCGTIGNKCGGKLDCGTTCAKPGWVCSNNMCKGPSTCVALTCTTGGGDSYCGAIGDGCGGTLDCGAACAKPGWVCDKGVCRAGPDAHCVPRTCTTASSDQYCGVIGDGCGGTLDCGSTCAKPGWVCEKGLCKAGPTAGCSSLACTTTSGDQYCGTIGDGCGGTKECGSTCSKPGWTCQDGLCKAGPTAGCTPLACTTANGDQYCGSIGDGCGNSLSCPGTCAKAGWVCDNHLCKGAADVCAPLGCNPLPGAAYCGTIGDGCGHSVACPASCDSLGADWTCDHSVCKGGPSCTKLTCAPSAEDNYCGTIGDGCGGALACPATCPKAGWTCEQGLCKAGPTAGCVPRTCTTVTGDQYCGDVGDGCGGTLHCGTTCDKPNWICENKLCKAGPGANCTPLSCTTANGDQYCGDIGDGCGGILHCGTSCSKNGWACQEGLCKAGPTANCTPLTCATASGDQYCGDIGDNCGGTLHCGTSCSKAGWTCQDGLCKAGPDAHCTSLTCTTAGGRYCGTIGDGCGGSLSCGTDCSAAGSGWVCGEHNACVGGPGCVRTECNNTSGVQQYCGDIGDNCGGTRNCPASCASGVVCGAVTAHVCEPCAGLCLKRVRCSQGTTSLSGTVYDPAGKNPLYNVIVSIPNADLRSISSGGPSCSSCDADVSGEPIATALTDANGHFVLNDVPMNTDFPLVMQLGKWRRQITISSTLVTHQCADNPIPSTWRANATSTPTQPSLRLPRKISDGDNSGRWTSMPKIAITTGQVDTLECLLTRIGIDPSEFTNPGGAGHINLFSLVSTSSYYQGANGATSYSSAQGGATFPVAQNALFKTTTALQSYDMVMVNCAGSGYFAPGGGYMTDTFIQNLRSYVNGGGKAFLEHYFASFLMTAGSVTTAPYGNIATWPSNMGSLVATSDLNTYIDRSFAKGNQFALWLQNAGASTTLGRLQLSDHPSDQLAAKYTAKTTSSPASRWLFNTSSPPDGASSHVHYFDFLTPVTQTNKCGRIVYTGVHVSSATSGADQDDVRILGGSPVFPTECVSRDLNAQEKALEFMFFDLSGCVAPPELPPTPPPPAGVTAPAAPPPPSVPPPPSAPPPPAAPPPAAAPPAASPPPPPPPPPSPAPPAAAAPPPPPPPPPAVVPPAAAPPPPPAAPPPATAMPAPPPPPPPPASPPPAVPPATAPVPAAAPPPPPPPPAPPPAQPPPSVPYIP